MTTFIEMQPSVRKALEKPLYTAMGDAGYRGDIEWPGLPFDRTQRKRIFTPNLFSGPTTVLEMGPNPLNQVLGMFKVGVRSDPAAGADENDRLKAIVAAAYPYATTLTFGGVDVQVDKVDAAGYGIDGAFMTGMVTVNWRVYWRS